MTAHPDIHRPVVVGVDGSPHGERALDWAAGEAELRGSPLVVLRAYPATFPAARSGVPGEPAVQPTSAIAATAEHGCTAAVEHIRLRHPGLPVRGDTVAGDARDALVEASDRAALLVVGARGLGRVRGLLMGSVSSHVSTKAHCPVVVVREAPSRSLTDLRVVVGVDGSTDSTEALRFAFEAASRRGAGLTVIHTWDLPVDQAAAPPPPLEQQQVEERERAAVAQAMAGFAAEFPTVDVRRHVVRGHAVDELVRQSANAALLVVAARGRGAATGLVLGSTSQGVLPGAHCPVAVLTAPAEAATVSTSPVGAQSEHPQDATS
jgi:nucleotide-binding universal stress UspA family protein